MSRLLRNFIQYGYVEVDLDVEDQFHIDIYEKFVDDVNRRNLGLIEYLGSEFQEKIMYNPKVVSVLTSILGSDFVPLNFSARLKYFIFSVIPFVTR